MSKNSEKILFCRFLQQLDNILDLTKSKQCLPVGDLDSEDRTALYLSEGAYGSKDEQGLKFF